MLYLILILILAVLLFGSSAVLGIVGWIFGGVAFIAAILFAMTTLEASIETVLLFIGAAVASVIILGKIADAEYTKLLGGPEARANYERSLKNRR
jgi:hypothetical protein